MRYVSWFSAGAASAVATKLILGKKDGIPVEIHNIFLQEEHPDNQRFLADCEKWFGQEIIRHRDTKYNASIYEVFRRERFINSPFGAACTTRLKRRFYKEINEPGDIVVVGFTNDVSDIERFERLQDQNNDLVYEAPLIERKLNKNDCLQIIKDQGIPLPAMYLLGYQNNNCIGCVKGGMGYWNKIRKDFPDIFERFKQLEEDIGHTSFKEGKRRFGLKELHPDQGHLPSEKSMQCGIMCQLISNEFADDDEE